MTAFSTVGNGPHAVICHHGWFGHSGGWGPWIDVANTTDFTWYLPDYRGYGSRQDEASNHSLEDIAADIIPIVEDAAKGHSAVSLLGHSMGGAYAQYVLHKAPIPITAYVGISPVAASGTPLPADQRAFFESAGQNVSARRGIIDITTGNRLSAHWLDQMVAETRRNSTDAAVDAHFRTWADADFLEDLGEVRVPALVIIGATDPAITAASVEQSYGRTFSDLSLIEFPDAGHYAMFEAPVRLATEIENFLNEHAPL